MRELAIKFKEARNRQGISQRDLSKLANVMQCTISRYEQGVQGITFETALKLAKNLNDAELINEIQKTISSKLED